MKNCIVFIFICMLTIEANTQTAESAYKAGMFLKTAKKTSAAIVEFETVLRLDPKSYKAMYELGWCYNDIKKYDIALSYLKKVRPEWPTIPKVFFELGYAFEKLNFIDSAKAAYYKCLTLKTDYKLAYKQLAYIEFDAAKYSESIALINKLIAIDSTGDADYLIWYRKGFSENATKKFNEAIISLNKSLQFKKDYINSYFELGFAHTKLKNGIQAISYFKQASKLDPKSHIPYNGIGEVYRDIYKNRDSAILWYNEALVVKPKERKASFGIGYCLNAKGEFDKAMTYLQEAITQEPTYTAAYVELGYAQYKTAKYDLALINFDKAVNLDTKNENGRYYKTMVYITQKNKLKAQEVVNELNKLGSKFAKELQEKVNKL